MGCRRRARATRPAAVLLSLLLVALGGLAVAVVPQAPAHAASPALRTTLDATTPSVTSETKAVELRGRVENTGKVPIEAVKASLWVSTAPITTREQLGVIADDEGSREGRRITIPESLVDDIADTLEPGEKADFRVRVPVSRLRDEYGMSLAGIYLVGVDIRGLAPGASIRQTWRVRTFLPWIPKKTRLNRVEVAYLLPLADDPDHVDGDTLLDRTASDRFAPDGRLSRLLDLGRRYDLSYLVDPALLEQARVMKDGYELFGLDDQEPTQDGAADAATFLDKATGLFAAADTLLLPYADPDLPALERHRMADRFAQALDTSARVAKDLETQDTVLTWPGSGYADAGMLETIAESGGDTVLLRQDALPSLPADGTNPVVDLVTPSGSLKGLVADPGLTGSGPGGSRSTLQTRQRFLAETALLAMRSGPPTTLRRVVAAFPRYWDPGRSGGGLFDVAARTPWLSQISVGALLSQTPSAYGGQITYPAAERRRELDAQHIEQLRAYDEAAAVHLDLLTGDGRAHAQAEHRSMFLRGASTAWRRHPERGAEVLTTVTADLETERNEIRVIAPTVVTLSSNTGRFPVTIDNNLRRETIRVQLEAISDEPDRLRIRPVEPIEIGPLRKATIGLEAEATGTSTTRSPVGIRLRLRTVETGTQLGGTAVLSARLAPYGGVGWAVIGAGVGLLFLVAAFRVVRRIRRARAGSALRDAEDTADTGEDTEDTEDTAEDTDGADVPEEPQDAPDGPSVAAGQDGAGGGTKPGGDQHSE